MDNQEDSLRGRIENNNQENFYEKEFAIELMKLCAIDRGLDTGCDIDVIFSHLSSSHNLLEVGAAYGRVLQHLQRLKYQGKITAIEKSQRLFNYLKEHYNSEAQLIHDDILDYHTEEKFDAILYMWSGISDFMPEDQLRVLQNLKSLLAENGKLFIETIYTEDKPKNLQQLNKQFYQLNEHGYFTNHYLPTFNEVENFSKQVQLNIEQQLIYHTPKNIQRCIYILTPHY